MLLSVFVRSIVTNSRSGMSGGAAAAAPGSGSALASPERTRNDSSSSGVVRADLQNGRIVLQLAESAETAPLVALVVQSGGLVEEVRKDKGSLEDVFLTLMEEER